MEALRRTMKANSSFSEASGAVLLLGASALDGVLGLEAWFLATVGVSLLAYGALLWFLARRQDVRPGAKLATVMDIDWIIAAAVILIAYPTAMTTAGRVSLAAVSLIVAGFAIEQMRILRRLAAQRKPLDALAERS